MICYHGNVDDVREYLIKCRCIIHPSFYPEGMSNVCLEAASCGRAVITTDRPGCRETLIDGKTGFMVPIKDKDKLIDAVRKFMSMSVDEQEAMGLAGRKYIEENFDRSIVVREYMTRLDKIIGR